VDELAKQLVGEATGELETLDPAGPVVTTVLAVGAF
jgi:hypothetical protein